MIKIFLTNLAAYNRGSLVGEWIQLPLEEKELEDAIQRVLHADGKETDEETFISDYGCEYDFIKIHEYDDPKKVNALAKSLEESLGDESPAGSPEKNEVKAIFEVLSTQEIGYILDVIQEQKYSILHDVEDLADLGAVGYENGCFSTEIPKELMAYIDWEAVGNSLETGDNWHIIPHLRLAVRIND